MSGPPPFDPSIEHLKFLSTSIQASISNYENAKTRDEKATAIKLIQTTSTKLSRVTSPIQQQFMELNHRPYINVVIRLCLELGLFQALPETGECVPITEISRELDATKEFLLRLLRVLAASEILEVSYNPESGVPSYAHTALSRFLSSPLAKASFLNHFENLLPAQLASVPGFYNKNGFASPADSKNGPFTYAHNTVDEDFFDILYKDPSKVTNFNKAMEIMAVLGLKALGQLYDFGGLVENQNGIKLVDMGGGKGQMLKAVCEAYPEMRGKVMLQDLKVVLDGGVVVEEREANLMVYDFFKEVQPVKGSNYFLKSILHDWSDAACTLILKNLAPAMRGHPHSKLLVSELVLADQHPDPVGVMRDINMLLLGGKERDLGQWNELLGKAGYKIQKVYGLGDVNSSIIEAVLDESRH